MMCMILTAHPPVRSHYQEGWIQNIKTHRDSRLVAKSGYDRLAETAVGFLGTILSRVEGIDNPFPHNLEEEQWEYYPSAKILFGDKILSYQTPDQPTTSKPALSWNLSNGVILNWRERGGGEGNEHNIEWLPVISDFQRYVLSHYVQNRMDDFRYLSRNVTTGTFGNTQVITNWSESESYDYGAHTLPPRGVFIENSNPALIAGIFNTYNGENLSSGDHYIIVEKQRNIIYVRHPMGNDTPIKITRPSAWIDTSKIHVYANWPSGSGEITATISQEHIQFGLIRNVSGNTVSRYEIIYSGTVLSTNGSQRPVRFELFQNYPNPFNPVTTVRYGLPERAEVTLVIYDILGRKVRTLVQGSQEPGYKSVTWDGTNDIGEQVSAGLYLYRIRAGDFTETRKTVLLR